MDKGVKVIKSFQGQIVFFLINKCCVISLLDSSCYSIDLRNYYLLIAPQLVFNSLPFFWRFLDFCKRKLTRPFNCPKQLLLRLHNQVGVDKFALMEGTTYSFDLPLPLTVDYPHNLYYPGISRGTFGLNAFGELPIYNLNNQNLTSKASNSPLFRDINTRVYFNSLTHPFLLFPFSSSNYFSSSINFLSIPKMEVQLDEMDVQWISSLGPLDIDHSKFYFPSNPLNNPFLLPTEEGFNHIPRVCLLDFFRSAPMPSPQNSSSAQSEESSDSFTFPSPTTEIP